MSKCPGCGNALKDFELKDGKCKRCLQKVREQQSDIDLLIAHATKRIPRPVKTGKADPDLDK